METIRVLIVDDHTLFREGVYAILKGAPDVEAVGEAATGHEAVQQAGLLSPDVILMDIQMPDMNGIEATQAILKSHPDVGVIMVTMLEDADDKCPRFADVSRRGFDFRRDRSRDRRARYVPNRGRG